MSLFVQLAVASGMVVATTVVHLGGLAILIRILGAPGRPTSGTALHRDVLSIVAAALGLFGLHGAEMWAYALLYDLIGATPDFESALYFSTSTYTTVGYGDVVLGRSWRVIGAIEGANGIILLGWSTAFFVAMVTRIRLIERWLERPRAAGGGGG